MHKKNKENGQENRAKKMHTTRHRKSTLYMWTMSSFELTSSYKQSAIYNTFFATMGVVPAPLATPTEGDLKAGGHTWQQAGVPCCGQPHQRRQLPQKCYF
jgi:hypothetical protein